MMTCDAIPRALALFGRCLRPALSAHTPQALGTYCSAQQTAAAAAYCCSLQKLAGIRFHR